MKKTRREFIKNTGLAGLALASSLNTGKIMNTSPSETTFLSPIDGDMLTAYDGTIKDGFLETKIRVKAGQGRKLIINGKVATYENGVYIANVILKSYSNIIDVTDSATNDKQSITIYWLKNVVNKYRLSLDDNIWFLKDINVNAGKYKSIFENPYLKFLKKVNDTYGTKIHLNLYYQTDGFNLSHLTTKFRNEWKENAGWLRLSFHALQNDPDMPYINAGYDEVKKDCSLVHEQIKRFAGEELMGPVTTLHWGEGTRQGCRALTDSGYKALAGYFTMNPDNNVSYYLDDEKRNHVNKRFIWKDHTEGIIFSRLALVINTLNQDKILPWLNELRCESHKPAYIDLMIHEQYFYEHYKDYQPDYREKVMTSVRWAAENGYKPAFLSECLFE